MLEWDAITKQPSLMQQQLAGYVIGALGESLLRHARTPQSKLLRLAVRPQYLQEAVPEMLSISTEKLKTSLHTVTANFDFSISVEAVLDRTGWRMAGPAC